MDPGPTKSSTHGIKSGYPSHFSIPYYTQIQVVNVPVPKDRTNEANCSQVVLLGKLVVLKEGSADANKARRALYSRHPAMKAWPTGKMNDLASLVLYYKLYRMCHNNEAAQISKLYSASGCKFSG